MGKGGEGGGASQTEHRSERMEERIWDAMEERHTHAYNAHRNRVNVGVLGYLLEGGGALSTGENEQGRRTWSIPLHASLAGFCSKSTMHKLYRSCTRTWMHRAEHG